MQDFEKCHEFLDMAENEIYKCYDDKSEEERRADLASVYSTRLAAKIDEHKHQEAIRCGLKALELLGSEVDSTESVSIFVIYKNLAVAHMLLGEYPEAEKWFVKASSLNKAILVSNNSRYYQQLINTLLKHEHLLIMQNKMSEADDIFLEYIQTLRDIIDRGHAGSAINLLLAIINEHMDEDSEYNKRKTDAASALRIKTILDCGKVALTKLEKHDGEETEQILLQVLMSLSDIAMISYSDFNDVDAYGIISGAADMLAPYSENGKNMVLDLRYASLLEYQSCFIT